MTAEPQLEHCADCAHVQYPPRGFCQRCLSPDVAEKAITSPGKLLSWTNLHVSLEPDLRPHLPLTIASVALDDGPVVITYFMGQPKTGQSVNVGSSVDPIGRSVLIARPEDKPAAAENLF